MSCKICNGNVEIFSRARLLGTYDVAFYRCNWCGFICSEEPYWLEEAYSSVITGSDIGLVRRNFRLAEITRVLLTFFFDTKGNYLDYAGGYGLFVRLMRDCGFDFKWYDRYCTNLFAGGCAADLDTCRNYDIVTAFELFEHLVDPVGGLDELLKHSKNILFTTDLLPEPAPRPEEWWYFGLEHGQHVSFYTRKSLRLLAESKGLNFYTNGATVHLITEKKLPAALFFLLVRHKTASLVAPFLAKKTLLEDDFRATAGGELSNGVRKKSHPDKSLAE
ncbi:MAG TPA: class I SAM-dependent methyltransferase [Desulfuromonadales bacterium]|nr:class I SAM-dependent methyltransferase [Desulfuromonadales bacterium]